MTESEQAILDGLKSGLWLEQRYGRRSWALVRWENLTAKPVRTFRDSVVQRLIESKAIIVGCPIGESRTRYILPDTPHYKWRLD